MKNFFVILGALVAFVLLFQNMTTYKTKDVQKNSSLEIFEEIRCEMIVEEGVKIFVIANYDLSTLVSNLTVKFLNDHSIEDVTNQGTRIEDTNNVVTYITPEYVFSFFIDDTTGIVQIKNALLEGTDNSYELDNNCHFN